MFTGAHDKLVDKHMFTTLLAQLKAAVLVKGQKLGAPGPCHARIWPRHCRVSAVLKVLSLDFNTPLIIYVYRRS